MGFLTNLRNRKKTEKGQELAAFTKTADSFISKMRQASFFGPVNDKFFEALLIVLLEADVGFATADKIVERVKTEANKYYNVDFNYVVDILSEQLLAVYQEKGYCQFKENPQGPNIILLVGVNGSGKTTSLAKLAYFLKQQDKKVLVCGADTFRAGAIAQLQLWAQRAEVACFAGKSGGEAAAAVVDACRLAVAENYDYLLVDTAGRLQNKVNLMNELAKIKRVAEKELGSGSVNAYLVIDATTGQNGINQAAVFTECCEVNGIILSKIDGTAKGGIILAIKDQLNIDVKYVGSGESLQDFAVFDIADFILALCSGLSHE